jgi:5-(carboxyamino)imidazole ribonucleotide synthase
VSFPVVGVVGGGQLARMMAPAAIELGVRLRVLATSPTESAAQVIPDTVLGSHTDLDALRRFAEGCDVVTFDHEHVPTEHLHALQDAGIAVRPGPEALVHAQDKALMRERLTAAGLPCPRWTRLPSDRAEAASTLREFGDDVGWPVIVKTTRGGYDGRGVHVVGSPSDAEPLFDAGSPAGLLVEEKVDFTRELAAQVARSPHGQAVAYPVVETVQVGGICKEVVAPARITEEHALAAQGIALDVAKILDVTGMLAVEMFDTPQGVLINELAMRPHNSGHWSMDGAVTSQFEQHLRAVLDLPLGDPTPRSAYAVMVNVLGGDYPDMYAPYLHVMARDPGLKVHMYGKDVRPGRKLGHVNVTGDDVEDLLERARHAAAYLTGEVTE